MDYYVNMYRDDIWRLGSDFFTSHNEIPAQQGLESDDNNFPSFGDIDSGCAYEMPYGQQLQVIAPVAGR